MIESLSLANYKAFKNATIPIKPLTILLGANSVGKSSVVQMLMLMHQTAESKNNNYLSALKIYGNYVNAGACENLFKNKETDQPLHIDVEFRFDKLSEQLKDLKSEYIDLFRRLLFLNITQESFSYKNLLDGHTYFKSEKEFKTYLTKFIKIFQSEDVLQNSFANYYISDLFGIPESEIKNISKDKLLDTYRVLNTLSELPLSVIKLSYMLIENNGTLKISGLGINIGKISIININTIDETVSSNLKQFSQSEKETIIKNFKSDRTIFDCFITEANEGLNKTVSLYYIHQVSQIILSEFRKCCNTNQINYVSPLRAHPKRYYILDKANTTISLNTLDGDEITEVLKENREVRNSVNSWLNKFDLRIDVNKFKEVVHHLNVTQNNLKLDITDVGFGISQVLPIIIQGFLSPQKSLTIIEQPEIHLHPTMQADLGDLFIDIVQKKQKKLIIETHSEYLLRRIRRRISEGKIGAKDVSICLFQSNKDGTGTVVESLEIGEKGSFMWPQDFYGGELYNDTVEFIKNQS